MNTPIAERVCELLKAHASFSNLTLWSDIFPSPEPEWLEGAGPLTLQVVDGGASVIEDPSGSVYRINFNLTIALFIRRPLDHRGRHTEVLRSTTQGIFNYASDIRTLFQHNFLMTDDVVPVALLVRPLVYTGESKNQKHGKYPDLLLRTINFVGGLNELV